MTHITRARLALVLIAVAAGVLAATAAARTETTAAAKPIVIGAVVDLTKNMAPFDAPALLAAQLEIKAINKKGGVDGRPLKIVFLNDQLDPAKTKQFAVQMLQKKVDIGWVTCDVNYAAPAAQQFLNAGKLTIAPCLGTDELSPLRFGAKGKLGFSFGNAAQDEGAAAAEFAYKTKGWKTAVVVTDNLLALLPGRLQGVHRALHGARRQDRRAGVVHAGRQDDQQRRQPREQREVGRDRVLHLVRRRPARVRVGAAQPQEQRRRSSTAGRATGTTGGRRTRRSRTSTTSRTHRCRATIPSAKVRAFEAQMKAAGHPAQTGGFLGGAAAIDGIAYAIKQADGSTNGAKLASIMVKFHKLPTLSGNVSFSAKLHTVFGRAYRVIEIEDNNAKFVKLVTASSPANIGH